MPDREKVIKGLQQHCEGSMFDRCGECPYYEVADEPFQCRDALLMDVLILLKAQEPVSPRWVQGKAFCSACGRELPKRRICKADYCPSCGRGVKWNA